MVRNVGFARLLGDISLGEWALTLSFLEVATPLALLGLTGGFGRFVEVYRRQGTLGDYLLHALGVSTIGVAAVLAWMLVFPQSFERLIYNHSGTPTVAGHCALAFVAIIVFTVTAELMTGLRHMRVLSAMYFLQSTLFTGIGLSALLLTSDWRWVVLAFASASVLACTPGLFVLLQHHRQELLPTGRLSSGSLWTRILPFAAALWVSNILSGLYETSDRYMLLHLTGQSADEGQAAVGQYHCGRILPNLMISLAVMLSGILLPYLSHDWENGLQHRTGRRMRHVLISCCMMLLAASAAAHGISPFLFRWAFEGRYPTAEAVLPLALAQAAWHGLFVVCQASLLCAERGRLLALITAGGLLCNLICNFSFIPRWGVAGAVAATALSASVALTLTLLTMRRLGWGCGRGAAICCCLAPLSIVGGLFSTVAMVAVMLFLAGRTNWLLDAHDRKEVDDALLPQLTRWGLRINSLWPQ
ncbi:MAG: spore cortex protein [Pirellulaceae bacterium]|nr:MAG: spore cortex protein [Pirellulaceae bacterium]